MKQMKWMVCLLSAMMAGSVLAAVKVASVKAVSADGAEDNVRDVLVRCGIKVGDDYDPAQCARDARALRDSGEYDDIRVDAAQGRDGVELTYVVRRKKRFQGPLNVIGNDYWGVSKITDHSGLVDGYAYGAADFEAAAANVRREYQKRFFSDVKVTVKVEDIPESKGSVTVTMTIDEGVRRKVRDFVFEGAEAIDEDELKASFDQFPWWNPIGWFTDVPATEQDLAEARDKVANVYRDHGYLDVEVSLPEARATDGDKIDRVFTVKEGPLYRVGKMSVTGVTKYTNEDALKAVQVLKEGDVAGEKSLQDAAHQVEVFCGSGVHALAETRVDVKKIPTADADVIDIIFAVTEGVPVTINRVLVRGNDYTKDKVIRREIGLSPGDPMLEDRAEQSKHRLENLRYFERVRYYLEKLEAPAKPGEPELRDLVYEVAEKNTGNFMVGIGASSVDSVYGTVELSESNFDLFNPWRFRGAGQKGRILVQAGPRIQSYEASVTEPHFLDRLLELTCEIYRRQRWYDEYDIIRNGAAATLSYPVKFWPTLPAFGRLGFRLSAEYIQFDDVEGGTWYDSHDNEVSFRDEERRYGDNWEVPFRIFWQHDTRDKFLVPTKGHRINIYGDLVSGDNEYWRAGFNARQYLTTWKKYGHVLSFGVRGETVDDFSGGLPIYDRLFLGGPRTIRGVDYREIAPRVWRNQGKSGHYEPWGGQSMWMATAEYTVPVVKFVRVAGFTDLGSVAEDEMDLDDTYFCWTVGVGLRLDIEQFPIRLDFATPIDDPDGGVDEEVFSFTVGYDF